MSSDVWSLSTSVDCDCSSLFSCESSIVVDANDSLSTMAAETEGLVACSSSREARVSKTFNEDI